MSPTDERQHHLLRFRGDEDDHPTDHLIAFHEFIHLLGVAYENFLMKMFMYSLDADAREWFRSLAIGTIYSLKELHEAFHYYSQGLYSSELLLENFCEEFKFCIHNDKVDSSSTIEEEAYAEFEKDIDLDQVREDTVLFL